MDAKDRLSIFDNSTRGAILHTCQGCMGETAMYVITLDLLGHFLQTTMPGIVILTINGALLDLLIQLDATKWKKHRRLVRGRWVIYVKCSKASNGTINAALLSYNKLAGHLTAWEFIMNPYKPCCWNKMKVENRELWCSM